MTPTRIRFIEPKGRDGRPFNPWISKWPLLGPITLASQLKARGYDVAVYSENASGPLPQNPEAMADICSADLVGISIMTPTANWGYRLADIIRARSAARIAFGGVHATFRPEEALAHGDVVVRGEAEGVIEDLASGAIRKGIVQGAPVEDLDTLPRLDHTVMRDFERLFKRTRRRELYELPVMTSRGCPYGCEYCTVTRMFGRRVRRQSVGRVLEDLRAYAAQGYRRVFFYDDNFMTDPAWGRELLAAMAPMGMRFNAQVRADFHWEDTRRTRSDHELLRLMHAAGANVCYIGFETIDDETASQWHKGYGGDGMLRDRLIEDTRTLHRHGIWIHGMFVIGPQHDDATTEAIVKFGRAARLESMQVSILTPFPGTPMFEAMKDHLVLNRYPEDWDYYDGVHCVYGHGRLGIHETQAAILRAHEQFYRWGGMNLGRLRSLLGQDIRLGDKVALLWKNAKTARHTLRAWKNETAAFLDMIGRRIRSGALPGAGPIPAQEMTG